MDEFLEKQDRLQTILNEKKIDALLLRRVSSFAWVTCGASSYVNTAVTEGASVILITRDRRYIITNNIEAPRLQNEAHLNDQGWEFMTYPWHSPRNVVHDIVPTGPIGSDICYKGAIDLSAEIARLRARLLPSENERFRLLGQDCASAMMKTIYMVKPGMTEFEIASKMSESCMSLGIQSIVNLVATDERIFLYRHPLPTNKKLGNYMMLVLSGRREGLVCSMTRLVSFGSLSAEIKEKSRSVATIDAVLIAETRPGITLSQIVQRGITMYADSGYPDEWAQHHQGGVTGYEPREYLATPTSTDVVDLGQAFAWNPSISGAKSEDTILVGQHRNEIITDMSDWPIIQINTGMGIVNRPGILEID